MRLFRPFIIAAALLLARAAPAQSVRPATDRIDAVVGQPLVVPLLADDERDLRRGLDCRLDDGRTIHCPVYWVGSNPPAAPRPGWTAPPAGFVALEPKQAIDEHDTRPPGAWYTLVAVPLDAVGQGLWIDGQRSELNWLPDPERTGLESAGRDPSSFFTPAVDADARSHDAVRTLIERFAASPFTRWRARLMLDGLDPRTRYTPPDAPRPEGYLGELDSELGASDAESFLDALAHQNETHWQIILGRIWLIDPALAARLKQTLCRVVWFESALLPMCPGSLLELRELSHDLLSPWVDDELRARRARAWLDTVPRASAWIIDDLGAWQPETDTYRPTIGIVSLPPEHGNSLVRLDAPGAQTTLETVGDRRMHTAHIATHPAVKTTGQTIVPAQQLTLRLGHARMERTGIAAPVDATPPGIKLGPLLRDWTMDALMDPRPRADAPAPLDRSTVGLLHRVAPPDQRDLRVGWTLSIQCAATTDEHPETDRLRVWIGPFGSPAGAWEITRTGTLTRLSEPNAIPDPEARVVSSPGRWSVQITLPTEGIADNLLLSIGLERLDAEGVHSAWPRRMYPGQSEPGRLLLDTSTWDGFREAPVNP